MAVTRVPNTIAESIIALITGQDVYVSLHSGDPAKTGANELNSATATGYARQLIATATGWNAPADDATSGGRKATNASKVDWGSAGADWGSVTYYAYWTAATGGTYLMGVQMTSPQTVTNGNPVSADAGELVVIGSGSGS